VEFYLEGMARVAMVPARFIIPHSSFIILFSVAGEPGLVFHDQLKVVAVRDSVVPDEPARLAFLHAIADPVKAVRHTDGTKRRFAGDILF
jgi:hypothetical protein